MFMHVSNIEHSLSIWLGMSMHVNLRSTLKISVSALQGKNRKSRATLKTYTNCFGIHIEVPWEKRNSPYHNNRRSQLKVLHAHYPALMHASKGCVRIDVIQHHCRNLNFLCIYHIPQNFQVSMHHYSVQPHIQVQQLLSTIAELRQFGLLSKTLMPILTRIPKVLSLQEAYTM